MTKNIYDHAEHLVKQLQETSGGSLKGASICLSYDGHRIAMFIGDLQDDRPFFARAMSEHENMLIETDRISSREDYDGH